MDGVLVDSEPVINEAAIRGLKEFGVHAVPEDFIPFIGTGEDVVHKKPSPDIYLLAAQKIGSDASTCIVVEDALNGIAAAKAASMKCIAIATSFTLEELIKEEPTWICNSIYDVLELVEKGHL